METPEEFETYLKEKLTIAEEILTVPSAFTLETVVKIASHAHWDAFYCDSLWEYVHYLVEVLNEHFLYQNEKFYPKYKSKAALIKATNNFLRECYSKVHYLQLGNFQYGYDCMTGYCEELFRVKELAPWRAKDCAKVRPQ